MTLPDLISEYRKHNDQLRQLVKESNHREIKRCDRRVARVYDQILNEQPTDDAEIKLLIDHLVRCLVTFPTDSSLNRRTAEKIVSLVSPEPKQAIVGKKREPASHGIAQCNRLS